MTHRSKKYSDFSSFSNPSGIFPETPKEWQEISATFTSLLQKTMVQNMRNLGVSSSDIKTPPLSAEWKKFWAKVTDETQKAMTQNMKNFGDPSFPNINIKVPPSSAEWKKIWTKVADETRKAIAQNMKNLGTSSFNTMGKAAFDPEDMTKTFTAAMMKMAEKPEKFEALWKRYLKDFQKLLEPTMENFQEKTTKIFLEPESRAGRDNPFFSLLQQSCLLNARYLKEAIEIYQARS